jgi:hypothetical protein
MKTAARRGALDVVASIEKDRDQAIETLEHVEWFLSGGSTLCRPEDILQEVRKTLEHVKRGGV